MLNTSAADFNLSLYVLLLSAIFILLT